LAVAYIFAAPVLKLVGPQKAYLLGGVAAAIATFMLLPLWRLGREADTLPEPERPISPVTDTG